MTNKSKNLKVYTGASLVIKNKVKVLCMAVALLSNTSAAFAQGKDEGSGVPGSPEMIRLTAEWKKMNESAPKDVGRERFSQNKYGMFIHWGLYSTLGGVWQGKKMEDGGVGPAVAEWIMRRKQIPRAEYAKLANNFNPVNFDADAWVAIAKAAGMRYMVITSKHHDGFALFDSNASDFNVVEATPFGRDIIKELEIACKKAGLAFGVYYSNALDWRDGGDSGTKDYGPATNPRRKNMPNYFDPSPQSYDDYIENKSLPQVRELLSNYELSQIWFDTPIYIPPKHSIAFYKELYKANPEILVNQRIGNGFGDIGTPGDNVIPDQASSNTWEGIATTNHSWGYKSYDNDWKSPIQTLYWLIENVSKGGNFLLNVGPDGLGNIPAESVANLLAVGDWLEVNGEAIYGSKPWRVQHEGPTSIDMNEAKHHPDADSLFSFTTKDFWFTKKDKTLYAIALAKPKAGNNQVQINSIGDLSINNISVLGNPATVSWTRKGNSVVVTLPKLNNKVDGFVLKLVHE